MFWWILFIFITNIALCKSSNWPCDSEVFCKPNEGLLHEVQLMHIFKDSKTFVDMPMKTNAATVLANFNSITNHSKESIEIFVKENFDIEGTELVEVTPTDWKKNPAFIDQIRDEKFKALASIMNDKWRNLTRKIAKSEEEIREKSSLIYLQHPFVVPGGRFREVYYWDSYWTIKGLLLSEMFNTTLGMIRNFNYLIKNFGHIPNGNRIYYVKRSQPPLLTQIVWDYLVANDDPVTRREFIAEVVWQLHDEFQFWVQRMVSIQKGSKEYKLARYWVEVDGPRPESYSEDYLLSTNMTADERKLWYMHMKSGAESGWDYSSRWFAEDSIRTEKEELLDIRTGDFIPVDLNSFLCRNAEILEDLFSEMENLDMKETYRKRKEEMKEAIREVLFNEKDGLWYDYNIKTNKLSTNFYPSNLAPLYTQCHHSDMNMNITLNTLMSLSAFEQPGGVPSSLKRTSQQWDMPNVWPPLVEITVTALENSDTDEGKKLAQEIAEKYLRNVQISFENTGAIYEKYNCEQQGSAGGGGEYAVQEGFGWTNGVALHLLSKYSYLTSSSSGVHSFFIQISLAIIMSLLKMFYW